MQNPEIEQLIDQMGSGYPAKREEARKALLALGPKAVSPLLDIINTANSYEENVNSTACFFSCASMMALAFLFFSRLAGTISDVKFALLGFVAALLMLLYKRLGGPTIMKSLGRFASTAKKLKNRAAYAKGILLSMEDIRCIEALCGPLSMVESRVYIDELHKSMLSNLLPKVKASDAALLSDTTRITFQNWLIIDNAREHADFLILILDTLERIGDETAIARVSGLATGPATSPEGIRVRAEARRCLAALNEHAELTRDGRTLLRPSEAPDEPNSLLRPASGHGAEDEQSLLRPSDNFPEERSLENRS
jgi:hypothetical protein